MWDGSVSQDKVDFLKKKKKRTKLTLKQISSLQNILKYDNTHVLVLHKK